jgi:glycine amidinotransferase
MMVHGTIKHTNERWKSRQTLDTRIHHEIMPSSISPSVFADNEWSQLRSVIVGCAAKSCFPFEPLHMIQSTMPERYQHKFQPNAPFPEYLLRRAEAELDQLARVLQGEGIKVYRPSPVDWSKADGYTAAMVRTSFTNCM